MGDMAEEFNALKAYHKEQREARTVVNIDKLKASGIIAKEQNRNTFRIDTRYGVVMYYPSSNKWQHKTKVYHGNFEQFVEWLRKHR